MTQPTQCTQSYPDGAPCWADLNTPDLAGAQRFYGDLLGWTFDEGDPEMGHYSMARKHGKVMHGPFDSPHGKIAVVADPYGAVFPIISRPAASA